MTPPTTTAPESPLSGSKNARISSSVESNAAGSIAMIVITQATISATKATPPQRQRRSQTSVLPISCIAAMVAPFEPLLLDELGP